MDITIQHPWIKRALGPFYPNRLFDQMFGEGLFDYDLYPFFSSTLSPYYRQSLFRGYMDSGISEVRSDRERFLINLDVKHFSPEDLTVKILEDFVEIHGKHSERQIPHGYIEWVFTLLRSDVRYRVYRIGARDRRCCTKDASGSPVCTYQDDHGYISREFHRRYRLPPSLDQSSVSCSLSADGLLTFTGPKLLSNLDSSHSERPIPVSREEKPTSAPSS